MKPRFHGFLPVVCPVPGGRYKGQRVGRLVKEIAHFFACPKCGEPVNMRDLGIAYEGPLPHPKEKGPAGWRSAEVIEFKPKTFGRPRSYRSSGRSSDP